jgi:hypothetical protein
VVREVCLSKKCERQLVLRVKEKIHDLLARLDEARIRIFLFISEHTGTLVVGWYCSPVDGEMAQYDTGNVTARGPALPVPVLAVPIWFFSL